jgi:hypothetical protein
MKYIHKINWTKVDEYRAKLLPTEKAIIAFTSTNEGTKDKPAYNAHILDSKNTIIPLGLITIERLISMGEKYGKVIPLIFAMDDTNYPDGNWQDFMRKHERYFMEVSKVRTAIISTMREYKLIKIENLV